MDLSQLPTLVGQTIDTLATKLQVPAAQLFEITTKGLRMTGIVHAVSLVLGWIVFAISLRLVIKNWKKIYDNDMEGIMAIPIAIGLILLMITAFEIINIFLRIFSPDYFLLKTILKL